MRYDEDDGIWLWGDEGLWMGENSIRLGHYKDGIHW